MHFRAVLICLAVMNLTECALYSWYSLVALEKSVLVENGNYNILSAVVECLTQDRGVVGSRLTGGTVLCP